MSAELTLTVPEWTKESACLGEMTLFDGAYKSRAAQRELCTGCPVRTQCLDDAMSEEQGLNAKRRELIRGGLTPQERATLDPTAGERTFLGAEARWGQQFASDWACIQCGGEMDQDRAKKRGAVRCIACAAAESNKSRWEWSA